MIDNIIEKLVEFQYYNPNIYIGGSIALMLQNAIPYRIPKDVDIISPVKIHIYDVFNVDRDKPFYVRQYKYNDLRWELFYNSNAKYIYYSQNGNTLKISPVDEIMEWKYKFQKKAPDNAKNNKDIEYYTQKILKINND